MDETSQHNDEISLRDLYLILKKGLPIIAAVALVAGALTFIVSSFLPPVFEAETTVLITPPPVRVQGPSNLNLNPSNEVSFEAYETLANSRAVLENALSRVPQTELSASKLLSSGNVNKLLGPQRPDQIVPLSVTHQVKNSDPELAATLADAWAETTLETVRSSLLASLNPVNSTTAAELARLETELAKVEQSWREFQEQDNGEVLSARLKGLTQQIAQGEADLNQLKRDIASAEAKRDALITQLQADEQNSIRLSPADREALIAQLELFQSQERQLENSEIQSPRLAEITYILRSQSDNLNIISLLNQSELRQEIINLSGLKAQEQTLGSQMQDYQNQTNTLQGQIAALDQERNQLTRELDNARSAYDDVAALQPIIAYVTELTPSNARILNRASVPTEAVGPRRTLNTALALVLGAMLAMLYVFLREAVAGPTGKPAKANLVVDELYPEELVAK